MTIDVLAFGAHPDDVEIGCGAVLAAASARGATVVIADATAGEAATHGSAEVREKERLRAGEVLGIASRPMLGLPDGRLRADGDHLDAVVELMRSLSPRIVLAPYVEDRHPDHAAAGRLARAAAFLVGVGGGARPARVYHYVVHHDFVPSFVVDVSETWERKLEALACYESQFARGDARTEIADRAFLDVIDARGTYHGSLIGARRGEAYWAAGPVPVRDLPDLDGPPSYSAFR